MSGHFPIKIVHVQLKQVDVQTKLVIVFTLLGPYLQPCMYVISMSPELCHAYWEIIKLLSQSDSLPSCRSDPYHRDTMQQWWWPCFYLVIVLDFFYLVIVLDFLFSHSLRLFGKTIKWSKHTNTSLVFVLEKSFLVM